MKRDFIKIAHLSDLHFLSGKQNATHYKAVESDLLELKPDVIVVTGDIVDNNKLSISDFRKYLDLAKNYLENLCLTCNCNPKYGKSRLFVVPGNHDYRLKGFIKIPRWSSYRREIFDEYFKDYFRSDYIQDINLVVGCFDSNTTDNRINFAQGEVLRSEFIKFNKYMENLKKELSNFETTRKIVLLHHHPMPIYRAEIQNGSLSDKEMFLLLENSATFIREMLKNNVRLIFHGHKHHRGISKASIPIKSDILSTIGVVSAGSVGKATESEYSFNIVDFYDSGRITVDYRILRGQGLYDNEGKPPVEFFSDEEARYLCFQELKSKAPTFMKRITSSYRIFADTGDLETHTIFENWVSNQISRDHLDDLQCSASGMFIQSPKYKVLYPQNHTIEWKPNGKPKDGSQKAFVVFQPKLDKEPIGVEISNTIPNAFFFTKEDRSTVEKEHPNEEHITTQLVNSSAEKMIMQVQFPLEFRPINPRVEVTDLDNNPQHKEQQYCNKSFSYSEILNCAFLSVDFPLFQRIYKIVWNLPSESDIKIEGISASDRAKSDEIKKRLLSLSPSDSDSGEVKNCLKAIYETIANTDYLRSEDQKSAFEVGIMVYDKAIGKLRYVAFFCPKVDKPSVSNIWECKLIKGQQDSGLALRRKETATSFPVGGPTPAISPYIRKPVCPSENYFTAIVAIPLAYPVGSKNIIGILELSSCSNLSGLLKLCNGTDVEKKAKIAALTVTANTKFLDIICNTIGIKI